MDLKFELGEEKTLVTSNIRVIPKSSGNDLSFNMFKALACCKFLDMNKGMASIWNQVLNQN